MTGDTRPDITARGPVAACAVPVPDATGQGAAAAPERSGERAGAVAAGYSCSRCGHADMSGLGLSRVCLDAEACHGRQCAKLRDRAERAEAQLAEVRACCQEARQIAGLITGSGGKPAKASPLIDAILAITGTEEAHDG